MAIITREATGHSVDTGLFPAYRYTKLSADVNITVTYA